MKRASTLAVMFFASFSLFACGPRRPLTPDELNAWMVGRFSLDLVEKVNNGQIRFEGGDGSSRDSAVLVVGASGDKDGVPAEYLWIAQKHGIQGRDWGLAQQSVTHPNAQGRVFDVLTVDVANEWTSRTYYFDITEFFGAEAKRFQGPK